MNVLQGIITRDGQAKLIQKLPVTAVDAGIDPFQSLAENDCTGHFGRNFRNKSGIVDTSIVDMSTIYQKGSIVNRVCLTFGQKFGHL